MFEHIVQMGPMLVLAGLIAGWVAEAASRAGGYGFIFDMVFGLVGSVVAGAIVWVFVSSDIGMPAMLVIGCAGAALAIARSAAAMALGPTRGMRRRNQPINGLTVTRAFRVATDVAKRVPVFRRTVRGWTG